MAHQHCPTYLCHEWLNKTDTEQSLNSSEQVTKHNIDISRHAYRFSCVFSKLIVFRFDRPVREIKRIRDDKFAEKFTLKLFEKVASRSTSHDISKCRHNV